MPAIPNIELSQFVPLAPLHWTSILHYLIILGAVLILSMSGEQAPILFLFMLAVLALLTTADLYVNLLGLSELFVFLARVVMFAIPIVIGGMGPSEQSRGLGILVAILALPVLVTTFLTCTIPLLADPRLLGMGWCR